MEGEFHRTKKNAHESFLRSLLKNKSKGKTEFYKYLERRKGNMEAIVAIKDVTGRLITASKREANSLKLVREWG